MAKPETIFGFKPGEMGPVLRPIMAYGQMLWGPATLRGKARPCCRCGKTIPQGTLAYSPMAGGDRGRRLHKRCALAVEKADAKDRAKLNAFAEAVR